MPQSESSLVDALLAHLRAKGQAMADMTPADQWRQFGQTALMAPMALRAGRFPENTMDMGIARQLQRKFPEELSADGRLDWGGVGGHMDPLNRGPMSSFEAAMAQQKTGAPVNMNQGAYRSMPDAPEAARLLRALQGEPSPPAFTVIPGGKP